MVGSKIDDDDENQILLSVDDDDVDKRNAHSPLLGEASYS